MRTFFTKLMLVVSALLLGCVSDQRVSSPICQVHHRMMRTVYVRGQDIAWDYGSGYEEARSEMFPNVYPSHMPDRRLVYYICDDCLKAQHEWFESHK